MKKIVAILLFCGSVSFASQEDGSIYYGADPGSPSLKTHVFLCRYGNVRSQPRPEGCVGKFVNDHACGCSACANSSRIGLALAFIRADTKGRAPNEYLKITSSTRNILWSAFMHFGFLTPATANCCDNATKVFKKVPGVLRFKYIYNNETFRRCVQNMEEFRVINTVPRLKDMNEYPHNSASRLPVCELLDDFREENKMHHLKRILRNAVFGWTIPEGTIPDVLRRIGEVCPASSDGRRIVPEYNYAGSRGYNCARFCMKVLDKLGVFRYDPPQIPKPLWKRMILPVFNAVGGGGGIALAIASGPVGAIGYGTLAILNFGFAYLLAEDAIVEEKNAAVIPNNVLENILSFYRRYGHEPGYRTDEFFIFAHNEAEWAADQEAQMGYLTYGQKDHYKRFLIKNLDDAILCNLHVEKGTNVFYEGIFEGRR